MRKIFSLIAAVLFAGSMMAATEVTFTPSDFSGQGTTNTGSAVSATKSGVTVSASKAFGTTQLRVYAHSNFVVESESLNIAKLNFTFSASDKTGGLDAEVIVGAKKYEVADLASQARFTEIKVTLAAADEVAAPAIAGDAQFFDEQEITITCGTEGASIYYTLDGTEPTSASTAYDPVAKFTISETKTVKAIAIKDAKSSDVTSKDFKKAESFASFEALLAASLPNNTWVEVTLEPMVIDSFYVSSQSLCKGIYFAVNETVYEIYYSKGDVVVPTEIWEVGGTIFGTVRANWSEYKGLWELVPVKADWNWLLDLGYADPEETAISNTAVEAKAVKRIVNGQLVIEKNGVLYNALGTQLR